MRIESSNEVQKKRLCNEIDRNQKRLICIDNIIQRLERVRDEAELEELQKAWGYVTFEKHFLLSPYLSTGIGSEESRKKHYYSF